MSNAMENAIENLIEVLAEEVEVVVIDQDNEQDQRNAEVLEKLLRYSLAHDPTMRAGLRKDLREFFEKWQQEVIYGSPAFERVEWKTIDRQGSSE